MEKICSICNKEFFGYGSNAQPINDGVCCETCDQTIVIPKRIDNLTKSKEEKQNGTNRYVGSIR